MELGDYLDSHVLHGLQRILHQSVDISQQLLLGPGHLGLGDTDGAEGGHHGGHGLAGSGSLGHDEAPQEPGVTVHLTDT